MASATPTWAEKVSGLIATLYPASVDVHLRSVPSRNLGSIVQDLITPPVTLFMGGEHEVRNAIADTPRFDALSPAMKDALVALAMSDQFRVWFPYLVDGKVCVPTCDATCLASSSAAALLTLSPCAALPSTPANVDFGNDGEMGNLRPATAPARACSSGSANEATSCMR